MKVQNEVGLIKLYWKLVAGNGGARTCSLAGRPTFKKKYWKIAAVRRLATDFSSSRVLSYAMKLDLQVDSHLEKGLLTQIISADYSIASLSV